MKLSKTRETNGKFINNPKDSFKGELKEAYKKINLTNIFLIASLILFFLDIVYRRLNLDISKYFKKVKKTSQSLNNKEEKDYNKINEKQNNDDLEENPKKVKEKKNKKEKNKKEKEQLDVSSLLKNKKNYK